MDENDGERNQMEEDDMEVDEVGLIVDNAESESGSDLPDDNIDKNRRKTAYQCSAILREELRKAEQGGKVENTKIDGLVRELGSDVGEVESLRTMRADCQALDQLLQLSCTQANMLRKETAKSLNVDIFCTKMKSYAFNLRMNSVDRQEDLFDTLERDFAPILQQIPEFYFLRPCFEFKGPEFREKVARKRLVKPRLQVSEVKSKTMEQFNEEHDETGTVAKELDLVLKCLRRALKQQGNNEMEYYRFVLNPKSFGETVQNMFYVSFLVRDGLVRLRIDANGVPKIMRLTRQERKQLDRQGGTVPQTVQVVPNLCYTNWEILIQQLGIKKAMIGRTDDIDESHG